MTEPKDLRYLVWSVLLTNSHSEFPIPGDERCSAEGLPVEEVLIVKGHLSRFRAPNSSMHRIVDERFMNDDEV